MGLPWESLCLPGDLSMGTGRLDTGKWAEGNRLFVEQEFDFKHVFHG